MQVQHKQNSADIEIRQGIALMRRSLHCQSDRHKPNELFLDEVLTAYVYGLYYYFTSDVAFAPHFSHQYVRTYLSPNLTIKIQHP